MLSGFTITPEKELIYCPISKELMRHPVIASDGAHYELKELYEHFKACIENRSDSLVVSPRSHDPITSVTYDFFLKSTLDANFPDHADRYAQYDDATSLLNEMQADLLAQQRVLAEPAQAERQEAPEDFEELDAVLENFGMREYMPGVIEIPEAPARPERVNMPIFARVCVFFAIASALRVMGTTDKTEWCDAVMMDVIIVSLSILLEDYVNRMYRNNRHGLFNHPNPHNRDATPAVEMSAQVNAILRGR